MGKNSLYNISGADVVLYLIDCGLKAHLGEIALRDAHFAGFADGAMAEAALALQQVINALDFCGGVVVSLCRGDPTCMGVHADAQDLADMVKNEHRIRDQIVENGDFEGVVRWFFYGRFDAVNKLVPDKAHSPAGEGRHTRHFDRLILRHFRFD